MPRYGLLGVCTALARQGARAAAYAGRALLSQRRIVVGSRVRIAWNVHFPGTGEVVIRDGVFIDSGTVIRCGQNGRIEIGAGTQIGKNCILETLPGQSLRIGAHVEINDEAILHCVAGAIIGDNCQIRRNTEIFPREGNRFGRLEIGDRVLVSAYTCLDLCADIMVGDDVAISPFCSIYTHNHTPVAGTLIWKNPDFIAGVKIGRGAWLGHGASIMPGVEIGEGAVVGAQSVVTKSVDAETVVGGVPAKLIRSTDSSKQAIP